MEKLQKMVIIIFYARAFNCYFSGKGETSVFCGKGGWIVFFFIIKLELGLEKDWERFYIWGIRT